MNALIIPMIVSAKRCPLSALPSRNNGEWTGECNNANGATSVVYHTNCYFTCKTGFKPANNRAICDGDEEWATPGEINCEGKIFINKSRTSKEGGGGSNGPRRRFFQPII